VINIFKRYKTFNEIIPDFLVEKEIIVEHRTFIGYTGKIKVFTEWLKENKLSEKPLRKISNDDIKRFSIYLANTKDLDKETCKKYREALSSIFKYAEEVGETKIIPFDKFIIPIKKRDCSPKYIPQEKQLDLIKDILSRDYQLFLACMIQYCSGIRPKELLSLKVQDISFDNRTIKVSRMIAKTGKTRYADLTEELQQYFKVYGVENADPELYIFGWKGKMSKKHISQNMLSYRFRKYRDKHGLSEEIKFYSWKHTGGTDLITSQLANLPQLQKHFGHDSIMSTQRYIEAHGGITNNVIKDNFKSPIYEKL